MVRDGLSGGVNGTLPAPVTPNQTDMALDAPEPGVDVPLSAE